MASHVPDWGLIRFTRNEPTRIFIIRINNLLPQIRIHYLLSSRSVSLLHDGLPGKVLLQHVGFRPRSAPLASLAGRFLFLIFVYATGSLTTFLPSVNNVLGYLTMLSTITGLA